MSNAIAIVPEGRGDAWTPGLHNDKQVEGWRATTGAVHESGERIVTQLWHPGRLPHLSFSPEGHPPFSPTALAAEGRVFTKKCLLRSEMPRGLMTAEFDTLIAAYSKAANNSMRADFDGVKIHGAHGYLLDPFVRDVINNRSEIYNGTLKNRARFLTAIMEEVTARVSAKRVGVGLSYNTCAGGMTDSDPETTFRYVVYRMNNLALALLDPVERDNVVSRTPHLPGSGDSFSVTIAPGVQWLRMPLEDGLDYIEEWAIVDGNGCPIVDTGCRTPQTVEGWYKTFGGTLKGWTVRRIMVTHLPPDRSGMAVWLAIRPCARLWMTRLEYLTPWVPANDTVRKAPVEDIAFYHNVEWHEPSCNSSRARFGQFGKLLYPIRESFQRIADGDSIQIGDSESQVVVGESYLTEPACHHLPELNLLTSCDRILPGVSSNVSVHSREPEADSLSDWLRTLADICAHISGDVLELPALGHPFIGLHRLIDKLIDGHEKNREKPTKAMHQPRQANNIFTTLLGRPSIASLFSMATGESLVHLHCQRTRGPANKNNDDKAWLRGR